METFSRIFTMEKKFCGFLFLFVIFFFVQNSVYGQSNFTLDVQYDIPTTTASNWSLCFGFGANEVGPSFIDIINLCPGPLGIGQISAVNPYNYAVFFNTYINSSIGLPINTTALQNGNTIFSTSTSFGIGNGTIDYNCSVASSSYLCWNVFFNTSLHYFLPGSYVSNDGYQTQPQIDRAILSAPCWNQTNGTSCYSPGAGLCAPGTCLGGDNCENIVPAEVPVVSNSSCQMVGTCDPYTGNYTILNKSAGTSCYLGDACYPLNECLANGTCANVNFTNACPLSNNICLLPPTCTSVNGTAVCNYAYNDGALCNAGGDYQCRQQDSCLSGVCVPGSPIINQYNASNCVYNYTCLNGTVTANSIGNGMPCNLTNKCLVNGTCDGVLCVSNTTIPMPEATFCNAATCDPNTGIVTYNSSNTGLDCSFMHPEAQCLDWVCVQSNCISFQPHTCPALPCNNATCDNSTGCIYAPLSNISCGVSSPCTGQGECVNGTCVNSGPIDCNIFAPPYFSSTCGYFYCDPTLGCLVNATLVDQPCTNNPCAANTKFNSNCVCTGIPTALPGCFVVSPPPISGACLLKNPFSITYSVFERFLLDD